MSSSLTMTRVAATPALSIDPEKRTLLIVDDDEGPRQALRLIFRDQYRVLLANNGSQAVEMASRCPIDAAVLDIRMGGMSGIELLGELKRIDQSTEVIMLTAFQCVETARQALRLGAMEYLDKPFNLGEMRAAVAQAMKRRSLSCEIARYNQKLLELEAEIHEQKSREEIARTRGEIYASIIHDLNGPLTVISGFADSVQEALRGAKSLQGDSMDLVKDRMARIGRQVNNCIDISRRYLTSMRGQNSGTSRVGVNQVLSDLSEMMGSHPKARGNDLIVRALPAEISAHLDGTQLLQVLVNLTLNAFQSSARPHRVVVTASLREEPARIRGPMNDSEEELVINQEVFLDQPPLLMLTVEDNGDGIPAGTLANCFEPYYTTKAAGEGTGLGLPIVKRIVDAVRGLIHVKSREGVGTTVTLYLPARSSSRKAS